MRPPPLLPHETRRLRRLHALQILDTVSEEAFDDYAALAAQIAGTPMALVTFVDEVRQWFKARVGVTTQQTPRDVSFCAHAIAEPRPMIVDDATLDPRFAANPQVTGGLGVRFYAGFPLRAGDGHALGTLCVFDQTPRHLSPQQMSALERLARRVEAELELRGAVSDLEQVAPPPAPPAATQVCEHCAHDVRGYSRCPRCARPVPDPRYLGARVAGRFDLTRLVGMGGIAQVYAATDHSTGATVAVKLLLPRWEADREMRERLGREATALGAIHHPGIVSLVDFGMYGDQPYLAVELVAGESLADEVNDLEPVPLPRVVSLMVQVADALRAAHAAGVVHRDLKPENVITAASGQMKLIDFGLAYLGDRPGLEKLTAADVVQGTPHYMAPERCKGGEAGPPADVYAMGVMLYELVTGVTPFGGGSAAEIMSGHLLHDPPPMAEAGHRRAVPESIVRLVRAALSKDPTQRPTAAAFALALTDPEGESPVGPAEPRPDGIVRRIQRLFSKE